MIFNQIQALISPIIRRPPKLNSVSQEPTIAVIQSVRFRWAGRQIVRAGVKQMVDSLFIADRRLINLLAAKHHSNRRDWPASLSTLVQSSLILRYSGQSIGASISSPRLHASINPDSWCFTRCRDSIRVLTSCKRLSAII
nr:hypothetical protein [Acidihalobacter prosperus]